MRKQILSLLVCFCMVINTTPLVFANNAVENSNNDSGAIVDEDGNDETGQENDENGNEQGDEDNEEIDDTGQEDENPEEEENEEGSDLIEDQDNAGNPDQTNQSENGQSMSTGDSYIDYTVEELYEIFLSLEDEEAAELFLSQLEESQIEVLKAYILEMNEGESVLPKTITFTNAAAFMPPVTLSLVSSFLLSSLATSSTEGIETTKTAAPNDDGTYTITIETWTTGEVIVDEVSVPTDIVLVLDQSGSMAYDFNGNSTSTNANRRQYALKQSVNNFIEEVYKKFSTDSDHRIAIVTYGSSANVLKGWTLADDAGKTSLQRSITGLPDSPSGATRIDLGMQKAESLFNTPEYYESNTTRNSVVIVFTDGVPTSGSDFSTTVADAAIESGKNLKDAGTTIYTIGIFNGADPEQLYGDGSNGTVGTRWTKTGFLWVSDTRDIDIPAGNRFLNYLSSNFMDATEIGIEEYSRWIIVSTIGWTITTNFTRDHIGYYLTASDADGLNDIFEEIVNNIEAPTINLGSTAVIKDVISSQFRITAPAAIKVYTDNYDGNSFKGERTAASGVNVIIENDDTIAVTDFDFDANFISDTPRDKNGNNYYGCKLIIEFTIEADNGFIGGNGALTNGSGSGVYSGDGNVLENFDMPTVDVPINYAITGKDDQICVGTQPDFINLITYTDAYTPDGTNNAYVDIVYTLYDDCGNKVGTYIIGAGESAENGVWEYDSSYDVQALTETSEYTLECKISPIYEGTCSSEFYTEDKDGNAIKPTVYVMIPTITWKDTKVDPGTEVEPTVENLVMIVWTESNDNPTIGVDFNYELTFELDTSPVVSKTDGKYTINAITDFTVFVKIDNETDISEYVKLIREVLDGTEIDTSGESVQFVINLNATTLTITKILNTKKAPEQSFIFDVYRDGDFLLSVAMSPSDFANGECTVEIEAESGYSYTVEEQEEWSWKYTLVDVNTDGTAYTFTNVRNNSNWIGGTDSASNVFKALSKFREVSYNDR